MSRSRPRGAPERMAGGARERREGARRREAARRAQVRRQRRRGLLRRGLHFVAAAALGAILGVTGSWGDAGRAHIGVPRDHPLMSYRVRYATTLSGVANEDIQEVSRPYRGSHRTLQKGKVVLGDLSNDDGLYVYTTGTTPGWFKAVGGHHRAVEAYRPVPVLREADHLGLATVLGQDAVLGRSTTLVRTGAPLGEPIKKATAAEFADLWVDSTGVVLRMDYYLHGQRVEHMDAVSFEPGATPDPSAFVPDPVVAATRGLTQVSVPLTGEARARLTGHIDAPAGFHYDGGQVEFRGGGGGIGGVGTPVSLEHYIDSTGTLLDVEHSEPGSAPSHGRPVALGGGRTGYLTLTLGTSFLTVDAGPSSAVTLRADDPQLLMRAARTLS